MVQNGTPEIDKDGSGWEENEEDSGSLQNKIGSGLEENEEDSGSHQDKIGSGLEEKGSGISGEHGGQEAVLTSSTTVATTTTSTTVATTTTMVASLNQRAEKVNKKCMQSYLLKKRCTEIDIRKEYCNPWLNNLPNDCFLTKEATGRTKIPCRKIHCKVID